MLCGLQLTNFIRWKCKQFRRYHPFNSHNGWYSWNFLKLYVLSDCCGSGLKCPLVSGVWKMVGSWGSCAGQQIHPLRSSVSECALRRWAWLETGSGEGSGRCILGWLLPPLAASGLPCNKHLSSTQNFHQATSTLEPADWAWTHQKMWVR